MKDYKIAVEIDLSKIAAVVGMAVCTWLSCICGEGEVLFLVLPAGLSMIFGRSDG